MNKKLIKILVFSLFMLMSVVILYVILRYNSNIVDVKGYNAFKNFINDKNTTIAKFFTFLGSTLFITVLCVSSLFIKKYRIPVISNTLIAVGISQALKHIIMRTRPVGIALIEETGYSFPSGHSMVGFAFYGFIIYLIYKSKLRISLKISLMFLFSMIIIMIGLSRIYLGVHYVTDVLGGYALAMVHLIIFIELIYKKYMIKEK